MSSAELGRPAIHRTAFTLPKTAQFIRKRSLVAAGSD
jgi:hypothetical protein